MSWQSEYNSALRSREDLQSFFGVDFPRVQYPLFLPLALANKIKEAGIHSVLGKQFLPSSEEMSVQGGRYDPIGDTVHSKGNQLIHRYQNRVLFTPTTLCPVLCRYCFRKNELSEKDEVFAQKYSEALKYLRTHEEINEVIFTGGDPLILSNEKLHKYLDDLSKIKSIKYVRFHSRTPVILPSRLDDDFIKLLLWAQQKFNRVLFMVHVNHADELSLEVRSGLKKVIEAGLQIHSQTVLLKGINDKTETLAKLFTELAGLRVIPYYLHHPDEAQGAMHFTLPLEDGRRIVQPLHNILPGWMLPKYVIDVPGGEGKIEALNPETYAFSGKLLNRLGQEIVLKKNKGQDF